MALISLGLPGTATKLDLDATNGVTLVQASGLGMPPVQNQVTDYAVLDGAAYQRTRVQPRTIMLQLAAYGTSWSGTGGIHAIRHKLVDAVNPHRAEGLPIRVYYNGNTPGRHIDAYYDAGLEMGEMDGFTETITLRLLAPDPFFYGNTQATATAGPLGVSVANYIITSSAGVWQTMGGGVARDVYAIEAKPGGGAYVGGLFNTAGTTTVNKIALWTGSAWNTLNAGIAGATTYVAAIGVAPNGDVYVGGRFNTAGSTAAKNVAMWDVSAGAWAKLSTGVVGIVRALDINRQGNLVVGGTFTTAGGITVNNIALWDGTEWDPLSTGLSAGVWGVAITPQNQVIAAGTFHTAGTVKSQHIAYWSGSAWSVPTGSASIWGIANNVYNVAVKDDRVYAVGAFRTAGGVSASRVAVWNGYNWAALGSGVSSTAYAVRVLSDGGIAVGGLFNTAGGHLTGGVATWNGYDWINVGQQHTGVLALDEDDVGRLYMGGQSPFLQGEGITDLTTITNNGTGRAYPVIVVTPDEANNKLLLIKNETNQKALYFDYDFIENETLTIDCRPGHKSVTSSYFGDQLATALLPGSDLATFCLEPGSNRISALIYDDAYAGVQTITFTWYPAYWGGD